MPYTYILRCADGTFYVGSTVDLQRRIDEHNLGLGSAYTRRPPRRRPVVLVWSHWFDRIDLAFLFEKQIQGWGTREADRTDRGSDRRAGGARQSRLLG